MYFYKFNLEIFFDEWKFKVFIFVLDWVELDGKLCWVSINFFGYGGVNVYVVFE